MDIDFQDINLKLGGQNILNGISGKFRKGKICVILGANGAGKSSLLSVIAGLREIETGMVKIGSKLLHELNPKERAKIIGYLPQKTEIHWEIDVKTLVELGRVPHCGDRLSKVDMQIVENAMQQTDCLHLKNRKSTELSGGEQSRVLLARVLAGNPEWMLADEPLASLDPAHLLEALQIFKNAAKNGVGVILILHDLVQAAMIADDVLILKDGKIQANGNAKDVLKKEIISNAYEVEVFEAQGPNGAPILIPIAKSA